MNSKLNGDRRVVITGLGVISSIGIGWEGFWKNLLAGKSGLSKITGFDTSGFDRHYAGEVKDFYPEQFFGSRRLSHLGRTSQMALAATKLALQDAGLNYEDLKKYTTGISIGTTMGEPQVLEVINNILITKGFDQVDPMMVPVYPSNGISSSIARNLNAKGSNLLIANACSAGNYSFGHAFDNIILGKVDMMIAGGADSFSRLNLAGFNRLFAVAPEKCQPFDLNRQGMIVGEGAGIAIIESMDSAQRRGANIYAEILGYGLSCDAHHMTAPDSSGITKAILKALKAADVKPGDVDYICAHGTGTEQNDKNDVSSLFNRFIRNTINITFGIKILKINGWRDDIVLGNEGTNYPLQRRCRPHGMA